MIPRRRSIRHREYDYRDAGAYFVTMVTHQRRCTLGGIEDGVLHLSRLGAVVETELLEVPVLRSYVDLDEYAMMPNHVHALFWITEDLLVPNEGMTSHAPTAPAIAATVRRFSAPQSRSLSMIVAAFKAAVSRHARKELKKQSAVWQRNFYERIVRDDAELRAVRRYIIDNPMRWSEDEENPHR